MADWLTQLPAFGLVLVRMTAFFTVAPVFAGRTIPPMVKAGWAALVALLAMGVVSPPEIPLDGRYVLLAAKEALVGLALGFLAALLFSAVQTAGGWLDLQTGYAVANLFDPQSGTQIPLLGHAKHLLAVLFFLATDGHHLLVDGIVESVRLVPVEHLAVPLAGAPANALFVRAVVRMMAIAVQLALPFTAALFLADLALGMLGRAVPQINVLVLGLPVKIGLNLLALAVGLPVFFAVLLGLFRELFAAVRALVHLLGASA